MYVMHDSVEFKTFASTREESQKNEGKRYLVVFVYFTNISFLLFSFKRVKTPSLYMSNLCTYVHAAAVVVN